MSFYKIRRSDKADAEFSRYIRKRDGKCVFCGRVGKGPEGINGLQNSHFFSRRIEATRFDPENCDAACFSCHERLEHEKLDPRTGELREYGEWKVKQLGLLGFTRLKIRAASRQKKDRVMSLLYVRQLMKDLHSLDGKPFGAKA